MDNDKFVKFQTALEHEHEMLEKVRKIADEIIRMKHSYLSAYRALPMENQIYRELHDAWCVMEKALFAAKDAAYEEMLAARRVADTAWQEYISSV